MSLLKKELDRIWNRKGVNNPLGPAKWRMILGAGWFNIKPDFKIRRRK